MKAPITYQNIFGETITVSNKKANPLIKTFGKGPEGERCKNCAHLYGKRYSKTYYKCDLRPDSNGPATDHKINWPACGKFEREKENNQ